VIRQNFGQCKLSGSPIVLESQPTDSLRQAIVQELCKIDGFSTLPSTQAGKSRICTIYLENLDSIDVLLKVEKWTELQF
jgi:hypothetical protein